jgi:sn1-specific diacylglycerol lipase
MTPSPWVADLKCWAFSPPGCMINRTLVRYVRGFVTAVVAGKDIVPRMSVVTLNRLVDEMVTSLGRCR